MTAATFALGIVLGLLPLCASGAEPVAPVRVKNGVPVRRARPALTEADVHRLLRDWPAFGTALATLPDSVPDVAASPGDLGAAEAAWTADARIRRALQSAGTDPEAFLALYRRIADAWWGLVEAETREQTAAGLRRELDALRATNDAQTEAVAEELERGLGVLEEPREISPDLDVVRRHRAELAAIFSPAAAGP